MPESHLQRICIRYWFWYIAQIYHTGFRKMNSIYLTALFVLQYLLSLICISRSIWKYTEYNRIILFHLRFHMICIGIVDYEYGVGQSCGYRILIIVNIFSPVIRYCWVFRIVKHVEQAVNHVDHSFRGQRENLLEDAVIKFSCCWQECSSLVFYPAGRHTLDHSNRCVNRFWQMRL